MRLRWLGVLYSHRSIYNIAIARHLNVDPTAVGTTLSITICFVGLGNLLGGPMISRNGPRLLALVGITLFFLGHMVSSLACWTGKLWLIYAGYGMLTGLGAGITFLCPVFSTFSTELSGHLLRFDFVALDRNAKVTL